VVYKLKTVPLEVVSNKLSIEVGILMGREEAELEIALSMLAEGLSFETIRKHTGLKENTILSLM
jgi:predicted transposase YdaD